MRDLQSANAAAADSYDPQPPEPIDSAMKAGETRRLCCEHCSIEYELTFEPKARHDAKSAAQIRPEIPDCCPFCGAMHVDGGSSE
jgi:hypothetical protein